MMRVLFALLLALALLPSAQAEGGECIVDSGAATEGAYTLTVVNPAIALRAYSAAPPVELTVHTSYDIPLTYTQTITRYVLLPPPPHWEVITSTIHTHQTVYTDTLSILGYQPRAVLPTDLLYTFRSPSPFQVWDCPKGTTPHTFLPRV